MAFVLDGPDALENLVGGPPSQSQRPSDGGGGGGSSSSNSSRFVAQGGSSRGSGGLGFMPISEDVSSRLLRAWKVEKLAPDILPCEEDLMSDALHLIEDKVKWLGLLFECCARPPPLCLRSSFCHEHKG